MILDFWLMAIQVQTEEFLLASLKRMLRGAEFYFVEGTVQVVLVAAETVAEAESAAALVASDSAAVAVAE